MAPDNAELVGLILNAAWWVRHYTRGGRSRIHMLQRKQAILALGVAVRESFNRTDDFEPLLIALVDGLKKDDHPPF